MTILTNEEVIAALKPISHNELTGFNIARAIESAILAKQAKAEPVFIVFDGPPDHPAPRFVDVETAAGFSVKAGEWKPYGDYWTLGPLHTHPQVAKPGWMPIETAPDDSTKILVFCPKFGVRETVGKLSKQPQGTSGWIPIAWKMSAQSSLEVMEDLTAAPGAEK